jgi:hypothetical protein
MNNKNLRTIAVIGCAALALVGCTSLEHVPINRAKPEELRSRLAVGENVLVRLHNGDERQFRIVALEPDAIVSRDERIPYADIDLIDVKFVDYKGTAYATGAIALLAVVFVGSALLDSELEDDPQDEARCRTDGSGGMVCRPY